MEKAYAQKLKEYAKDTSLILLAGSLGVISGYALIPSAIKDEYETIKERKSLIPGFSMAIRIGKVAGLAILVHDIVVGSTRAQVSLYTNIGSMIVELEDNNKKNSSN